MLRIAAPHSVVVALMLGAVTLVLPLITGELTLVPACMVALLYSVFTMARPCTFRVCEAVSRLVVRLLT